jgi:RNA polymerase sigma-70 factor (ECF subfamily)
VDRTDNAPPARSPGSPDAGARVAVSERGLGDHGDLPEFIERLQRGDARAFDELVRQHQKPIYYTALRYVKNPDDAADVTQKTFVRAYRSLASFRGESALGTWLTRIAINLSLNHLRDHARERPARATDDITELADPALMTQATGASRIIREQQSAALQSAIDSLPERQRLVLSLRVFDELSFREVAELVGSSENAAKVNFHHAVKRLRTLMTQDARPDAAADKERLR